MREEYQNILENSESNEFNPNNENILSLDNEEAQEYSNVSEWANDLEEAQNKGKTTSERRSGLTMLSGSLTAIIASVVVGVTTMLNVNMKATMNVNDYDFATGKINFVVNVEDMTEKETLAVYLYENGEVVGTYDIVDEEKDGVVEGYFELNKDEIESSIQANDNFKLTYELKLKGVVGLDVEREFDSYITTIEKHTFRIDDVDMQCHCNEDGCYHFKINYEDIMCSLSDFEAYIEDEYGNISSCVFTGNYHDEQKIYVANFPESPAKLYISYIESGVSERQYIMFDNGNAEKDNYKKINI